MLNNYISILSSTSDKEKILQRIFTPTNKYTSIINKLKEHIPYSLPFHHRVSKRDAPNYYDIIKHPMDLTTMSKKCEFYNDETFKSDLDLIWSNCFLYNAGPIFIQYATEMKKYSNFILNTKIKDYKIQRRNGNAKIKFINNHIPLPLNNHLNQEFYIDEKDFKDLEIEYKGILEEIEIKKRNNFNIEEPNDFYIEKLLQNYTLKGLKDAGFRKIKYTALNILVDVMKHQILKIIKEKV